MARPVLRRRGSPTSAPRVVSARWTAGSRGGWDCIARCPHPVSRAVAARHLAGRPDVEQAAISGAYAARAEGELGPPPGDIDLLLIGDLSFEDAYGLAHAASRELGVELDPVIRTTEEWDDDTGFVTEVRARPTIVLKGPSA